MSILIDTLKRAIEADPRSDRQIAIAAGVEPSAVCRMLSGERALSINAAERLAAALGLEITIGPTRPKRKGR